jgi:hypothetical protein
LGKITLFAETGVLLIWLAMAGIFFAVAKVCALYGSPCEFLARHGENYRTLTRIFAIASEILAMAS